MLISLLVAVLVLALIGWVISMVPMDPRMRQIVYVILAVVVVVYLISMLAGAPVVLVR